jgi:hypothetical protein
VEVMEWLRAEGCGGCWPLTSAVEMRDGSWAATLVEC